MLKKNKNVLEFDISKYKIIELFEKRIGNVSGWNDLKNIYHRSEIVKIGHEITHSKEFYNVYKRLILTLPLDFSKEIYFQKAPTFRISLPKERTTPFHTDNISSGHGKNIINFWMPLSSINKYNTLWIVKENFTKKIIQKFVSEKLSIKKLDELSSKHANPSIIKYGQILKFNNLNIHGSVLNNSNELRVSIDFRILNGDIDSGIKNLEEEFLPIKPYSKKIYHDVISIVFSNHKFKHISHSAQRKIINEYCELHNFKVELEAAEWYNLDHYPLLEEYLQKHKNKPLIIFSKKCFDEKKMSTKKLFKNFKSHNGKVHFALENEVYNL